MRTNVLATLLAAAISLMVMGCGHSGRSHPTGPAPAPVPTPTPFPSNPQPDDGKLDPSKSFMFFASVVPGSTQGTYTMWCDFANGSLKPVASRVFKVTFQVASVSSGDVQLFSQLFNGGLPVQFPDKPLGAPPNIRVQIEENGVIIIPFTPMLPSSGSPVLGYKLGFN